MAPTLNKNVVIIPRNLFIIRMKVYNQICEWSKLDYVVGDNMKRNTGVRLKRCLGIKQKNRKKISLRETTYIWPYDAEVGRIGQTFGKI